MRGISASEWQTNWGKRISPSVESVSYGTNSFPRGVVEFGAGDGNRTRMASLEGWNSAIELHPQQRRVIVTRALALSIARCIFFVRMSSLLLTGGRVIDPAQGFDSVADVFIRDGKIAAVGAEAAAQAPR